MLEKTTKNNFRVGIPTGNGAVLTFLDFARRTRPSPCGGASRGSPGAGGQGSGRERERREWLLLPEGGAWLGLLPWCSWTAVTEQMEGEGDGVGPGVSDLMWTN